MVRAPLWDAVRRYLGASYRSWHVPAHKQGRMIWPPFKDAIGEEIFKYDLTELPGLGDLHHSRGPVAESQALTARLLGAGESFFLVNGASAGIQAAFLAYLRPGQLVLLPRNMHLSVVAALIISGAQPVYLPVEWHRSLGLPLGIAPGELARALADHPGARMLLLLHPSYEGVVGYTAELTRLAQEHGVVVVADAAHGGHFPFHPQLPPDALAAGADVVVHGWHKTVGSLTQTAVVSVRPGFPGDRLARALDYLQTTSPSYLLLLSLEAARRQVEEGGRKKLERVIEAVACLKKKLRQGGVILFDDLLESYRSVAAIDPLKLVVGTCPDGSGFQLATLLREQCRLEVEAAGPAHVLFYLSLADAPSAVADLSRALLTVLPSISRPGRGTDGVWPPPPWPEVVMTPREAFFAPTCRVSRREAQGRVAAETVAPYPPGIPVVVPGERITPAVLEYLELVARAGLTIHGAGDPSLEQLAVVGEF